MEGRGSRLLHGIFWLVAAAFLNGRCEAWRGLKFSVSSQFVNKKMAGGDVVTYYDVTPLTCAARCSLMYPCSSFTYSARDRVCVLCALCGRFNMVDAPGYQLFVASEDPVDLSIAHGAGVCADNATTTHKCWKPSLSPARALVSIGPVGVMSIDLSGNVYFRSRTHRKPYYTGHKWKNLDMKTKLSQLDVGTDVVWGVTIPGGFFFTRNMSELMVGKEWTSPEQGKWISVSPGGSLWAVNAKDQVVHYQNSTWKVMGSAAKCVDVGQAGVWMLNTTGHLLYREGTYGDGDSPGSNWRILEGTYQSLSSGRDLVAVVDREGRVWLRTAVGPNTPTGLAWLRYPGSLKQVQVYHTSQGVVVFWGTDVKNNVFYSHLIV